MRALIVCLALSFAALPAAADMVVLTIAGAIAETNRGPSVAEDPTVLAKLGAEFEAAFEFDTEALAALPQESVTSKLPGQEATVTYSGPKLSAVLGAVGAEGESVFATALDGYVAEIPAEVIAAEDPILATHLDGAPMGIGGLGPTMVVFAPGDDGTLAEGLGALQVWATVFLQVE